jgi:hypothetical protein
MAIRVAAIGVFLLALAAHAKEWDVLKAGAVGDGKTDNTAVFQGALDDAAKDGGGIVTAPTGDYCIRGNLKIPGGVTLQGTFRVPPTNDHETRPRMDGSVLLAYAGRGAQDGPPFITLAGSNATLAGFIVTYPEWKQTDVPPAPYPPTVYADYTANVGVLDCCFLNTYEAIHFQNAGRFLVRNVHGYPSFRGFYTDNCCDIGRVENCHFWPFGVVYQPEDPYCLWINTNGVAFEFARTDWQYVINTFCFGYGVGYKFSESKNGSCNGNFVGLGADCCRRPVLVEQSQWPGLLITNGEFVGRWGSTDSVGIEIAAGAGNGKVSLSNCSFWGPIDRCIWSRSSKTQLTVIGTNLCNWDVDNTGAPAIRVDAGKAIIQGNTFGEGETHVRIGDAVVSAIVMGNQAAGGLVVENLAGLRTQLVANEVSPVTLTGKARAHYRIRVGEKGDQPYVRRWCDREKASEWPGDRGAKRWSSRESTLKLPVLPRRTYTITLEVYVPNYAVAPQNGLYLGTTRIAELPQHEGLATVTGVIPPGKGGEIVLAVRAKTWHPKDRIPNSNDTRTLGIGVRSVTMQAKGAGKKVFDANTGEWAR